jgi:hypothetical protein
MQHSKEADPSNPGKSVLNLVVAPAHFRFINIDEDEFPSQSEIEEWVALYGNQASDQAPNPLIVDVVAEGLRPKRN